MKRLFKSWLAVAVATVLSSALIPAIAQPDDTTNLPTESILPVVPEPELIPGVATNTTPAQALRRRGPVVSIGANATVATGETAELVVAIGGSAKVQGEVREAVVAIGGDAEVESKVRDAVVAIGGNAIVRSDAGDVVVAIGGNAEAYGEVRDVVVAILGDVKLGSNAVVRSDVVAIGGKIDVAEGAQIKGQIVEISIAQYPILAPLKGLTNWLRDCALKLRLLAPKSEWYWVVAGIFFLLYLLVAAALPRPVAACVKDLQQRPATTFLVGLLMKLLLPLVYFVLALTGIGIFVIPFVWVAVLLGGIIGKVALLEYFGRGTLRLFGINVTRPIIALVLGFVLITITYMVPILSLLIFTLTGIWALGAVTTATFAGARKEVPPRPPYSSPMPPVNNPPSSPSGTPVPPVSNFASATESSGETSSSETATPPPPHRSATHVPEAYTLPRAGFWERIGAAFLDMIIVAILSSVVGGMPFGLLVALAYFAGMWTWKGTTIGGIVLNLKVIRCDDQPVTFAVALVRSLASAFSVIVFFLGFFWLIFDRDKQTWHDKIAGTVVVRTPRAVSLVCL